MFNVGPLELMVLAIVALVVLGPEKLPNLARDAARMIRTLRDLATGAREQLRDELGPEFADVDLRNLNPRHAISRVLLGDEFSDVDLRKYDPRRFDARAAARDYFDDSSDVSGADTDGDITEADVTEAEERAAVPHPPEPSVNFEKPATPRPRPRPNRTANDTPYDSDAT